MAGKKEMVKNAVVSIVLSVNDLDTIANAKDIKDLKKIKSFSELTDRDLTAVLKVKNGMAKITKHLLVPALKKALKIDVSAR